MKVLVIEDNDTLRENIAMYLELQKFQVDTHNSYTWASYKIITKNYDVIILDLGLGNGEHDGLDICKEVRSKSIITPILMLTARTQTHQKVEWLEIWADDYMTKPFAYTELLARLKSLHRREKKHKWNNLYHWDIYINKESMEVFNGDKNIQLSKLEYDLLLFLMENKWVVMKKDRILEAVWWDIDLFENTRKLDIYIGYIRKKMWSDLVETVHGIWYKIV